MGILLMGFCQDDVIHVCLHVRHNLGHVTFARQHDRSQVCWELLSNAHILPVAFQIYEVWHLFNCNNQYGSLLGTKSANAATTCEGLGVLGLLQTWNVSPAKEPRASSDDS
jgi:hypothetical protein